MIIYHFKQRITVIEKKTETTIEILNNLAKETTALRGIVMNLIRASHGTPMFEQFLTQPDFNSPPQPMNKFNNDFKGLQKEVNNITIDLNENNVKVKHLDISEISNLHIIEDNDTESESDMDEDDDSEESDDDAEDGVDADNDNTEKKEEILDTFEKIIVLPEAEIDAEVIEVETTPIQRIEDYSKLTTSQLKNIVLDKKLYAGNVNKLKRPDLLKLLQ